MKISKALKESIAKQNSNWYSPSRERERGKKFKLVYTQSFAFVDGYTDHEIEVYWNFSSRKFQKTNTAPFGAAQFGAWLKMKGLPEGTRSSHYEIGGLLIFSWSKMTRK